MKPQKIAVGLYVYNGELHLASTLDSLLSQTMGDFVLNVSDNASTDATEEICRGYEKADPRVRYIRHVENRGPTWNCNFVAQVSPETEFFKWCAHDDVYDPTYLERCVGELQTQPAIVACHSRSRYINERGEELMRSFRQFEFSDDRSWVRLQQILLRPHDFSYGFAVIRRSALRRIRPLQPVFASDAISLSELAFQGPFGLVPEHLFANRMHPKRATAVISRGRAPQVWAQWFGGSIRFPLFHTFLELRKSIGLSQLGPEEKARCYGVLSKWIGRHSSGFGLELVTDGPQVLGQKVSSGWRRASGK
jgi:glycosyltransferase involved in cell wall biosynthesis